MVVTAMVVPRARRLARWAMVGAALGVAATGCYYEEAQYVQDHAPDTRPWFCLSSGVGGHHGDSTHVAHPAYDGAAKGALGWDDCLSVARSFDAALGYANQFPTKAAAESRGWSEQVAYTPGMGTHHMNLADFGKPFDPNRPVFLQYGGEEPDAPLVGLTWWVQNGSQPPEGFPGGNDWWHSHGALCFMGNRVIAPDDSLTDEECRFYGGYISRYPGYYMLHAWVVPGWTYKPDVFAGAHPCLLENGIAPAEHACWAEAAGTGPDHGGGHGSEHDGGPGGHDGHGATG